MSDEIGLRGGARNIRDSLSVASEAANRDTPQIYEFGPFRLEPSERKLLRGNEIVALTPKAFDTLVLLVRNSGHLMEKDELLRRLWPDSFVEEGSLSNNIFMLRKALGEDPPFIETVPRRGYRFVGAVRQLPDAAPTRLEKPLVEGHREVANEVSMDLRPSSAVVAAIPMNSGIAKPTTSRGWALRVSMLIVASALLAGTGFFIYKRRQVSGPPTQRPLTRVTFDDGLQSEPTWSPDDRYIAYSSDRGGKCDIWVQQVSGGDPIQITKGPGHHWQPDWSPDGKYIAYRSEEGDGGIYVVPALGGAGLARKVAPFGYHPRWSPNSLQLLFQTHFTAPAFWNRFYVGQLDGSAPREVLADFIAQNKLSAGSAVWYPDGKRVTVWVADFSPSPSFWTVSIAGGPGIKLEIAPAVQRKLAEASGEGEVGEQLGDYSFSWSTAGDVIYFERGYRGARNIWKMTVNPETMRATGIDRLTTGPGPDAGVAISTDGRRLAFTAKSQRIRTWLFSFDATAGHIRGSGEAITSPGRMSVGPTLSPDGAKVAYVVPHGEGNGPAPGDVRNEVWVKSLVDGSEVPVISDGYSRWAQRWSPDSMRLAYERRQLGTTEKQLMVWSSQSHEEEPLTTPGSSLRITDWSPDGKWLLAGTDEGGIWLVPFAAAPHAETAAQKITSDPAYELYQARFSPDSRWIVFEAVANSPTMAESALFVVPATGGAWRRIIDGKHWDDKPRWSPDGKTIYFVSGCVGFFNLWGIHFDPTGGKTVGQPFQVSKFESARLMVPRFIPPVGLSLTQDKLVLTMADESGSIWVLENVDR